MAYTNLVSHKNLLYICNIIFLFFCNVVPGINELFLLPYKMQGKTATRNILIVMRSLEKDLIMIIFFVQIMIIGDVGKHRKIYSSSAIRKFICSNKKYIFRFIV